MKSNLVWEDRFQPVLDEAEAQHGKIMTRNAVRYTAALLRLLKEGKSPSVDDVVNYIYNYLPNRGGWGTGFDKRHWGSYHPGVVAALKSEEPMNAFKVYSER